MTNMKPHNPDELTPEQVGVSDGYRLLDEDEIKERGDGCFEIEYSAVDSHTKQQFWFGPAWGCHEALTYRTKLTREELAKLK